LTVAAARFDTRVMGYQLALLLLARDSKRLWVIAVHEAIRAGELGLGRAIEAGLALRRNGPKGPTRSTALGTPIDGESCRELRSLSLVHSLDNPQHENKNGTWIANQLTQVSVAARHSWRADACDIGAVISPLRQNCLSIANKVYAAATRDWKCQYG
jgi:hypothetical protein